MNRTKALPIFLSIALIASMGVNFYNYSQSKALSHALDDTIKQVETLTQELEQSRLELEAAAEVKVPEYSRTTDDMSAEELLVYLQQINGGLSSAALPDGASRYKWDVQGLGSEYYTVPANSNKSTAQRHQEYRQLFNISDTTKLDVTLNIFNDRDGNGVKDYIEQGRPWDYKKDVDPDSELYRNYAETERLDALTSQAIAEGGLDEHIASKRPSTPFPGSGGK